MIAFIDHHRGAYGVEPICKVVPIAPSIYHAHVARRHVARRLDPSTCSARALRDEVLRPEIERVFAENFDVNRVFHTPAPNQLWLSDFTYVSTWSGFVYVAFVIDAYARRIVGWRVSRTAHASFVLDALEQARHERRPAHRGALVHHSDRGSQYVSIR